ncbi:hypothetical protein [Streptomyces sp. CAU 1734]|uniref:DUF7927 domain-containing protein n=1 Tax=Streptomyces sp. CAU 1734 TaxID=3140360 RepID=UPI00326027E0
MRRFLARTGTVTVLTALALAPLAGAGRAAPSGPLPEPGGRTAPAPPGCEADSIRFPAGADSRIRTARPCPAGPSGHEGGADLAVTTGGPAAANPDGTVAYSLVVTNHGPGRSSGWTLSGPAPAGGLGQVVSHTAECSLSETSFTCGGGPLAAGDSHTVHVIGTAAALPESAAHEVTVIGRERDPEPGNNTARVTGDQPGLTLTRTQRGLPAVDAGTTVEYTVTAENTGSTAFTEADPASFTDDLTGILDDAGLTAVPTATSGEATWARPVLSWSGALAPGESVTVAYSVTTHARPSGDLELLGRVVSETPGSNCAPGSTDTRCATHGKVNASDKNKHPIRGSDA